MALRQARIPWSSAITEVRRNYLATHGVDQREIIREFSFEEMVYFLLMGERPTETERDLLRAVLVSHISHGITGQSTLAVIEAADCRSDFLHALVAGFSVGAGVYHQGGLRATMESLTELAKVPPGELGEEVQRRLDQGERIMGFGHRFHDRDPRVDALLEVVERHSFVGKHIAVATKLDAILRQQKSVAMNIEAAGGAILLDLGFDPKIGHLIIVLGRSPMFAAAYLERLAQGRSLFQRIEVVDVMRSVEGQ